MDRSIYVPQSLPTTQLHMNTVAYKLIQRVLEKMHEVETWSILTSSQCSTIQSLLHILAWHQASTVLVFETIRTRVATFPSTISLDDELKLDQVNLSIPTVIRPDPQTHQKLASLHQTLTTCVQTLATLLPPSEPPTLIQSSLSSSASASLPSSSFGKPSLLV